MTGLFIIYLFYLTSSFDLHPKVPKQDNDYLYSKG